MHKTPSVLLVVASLVLACGDEGEGGKGGSTTSQGGTTDEAVTITTLPVTTETLDTTISTTDGSGDADSTGDTSVDSTDDGVDASDTTSGAVCGDGEIDAGEDCDGRNLAGEDCTSIAGDFIGGELACSETCTFDTQDCIPGPLDVEFCRLQYPLEIVAPAGSVEKVYGRVYVEGVTDQSPMTDPHPALSGWVGYGPENSNPSVDDTDWIWIEAEPNPGYDENEPFGEPNNDEYWADLTIPPPGTYAFAFRFSGDLGQTFVHCDGDEPGNTNGYDPAEAGHMTSTDP